MIEIVPVETDRDLDRHLAVRNAVDPDDRRSAAEEQRWLALHGGRRRLFLGLLGAEPAGAAMASPPRHGGPPLIGGWVLPARRRQGLGAALFLAAAGHARDLGATSATARASDADPDGRRFLEGRGWRELLRERRCARRVDGELPPREAPDGVTIADLALDSPELRHVYDLDVAACADIPGPPIDLGSFERWCETELGEPGFRPPILLVARAGPEIVGFANVHFGATPAERAWHGMTGVAAAYRGRGVARAIKIASLHAVRALGCVEVAASNDERNVPMRRVNERLGYLPLPDEIVMEGDLP